MALALDARQMGAVRRHAVRSGSEECCGVLVGERADGRARVVSVIEAENVVVGDRRRRYAIDPRVLLDAHRQVRESGGAVIGYYHSHPHDAPVPSVEDAAHAWPGVSYLILGKATPDAWSARCWRWRPRRGFLEEAIERVDE